MFSKQYVRVAASLAVFLSVFPAIAKAAEPSGKVSKPSDARPKQAAVARKATKGKTSVSQNGEDKAISLVEKSREVRAWEKDFGPTGVSPATNGKPGFDIESHHGSIYVVHVFEDKPEQALTFARYEVNIKTGRLKKVD
ncbi:MAG TPA: hypothetical protein V6C89_08370 [Drouetiella sp.]|jgi:hypothetical protein